VRFEATDVFGREQKARLLVQTPPCVLKPKGIATFDPHDVFRDPLLPLRDPVPFRPNVPVSLLRDRLAAVVAVEPMAEPLIETVTTALTGGLAQLDATAMVMQLLPRPLLIVRRVFLRLDLLSRQIDVNRTMDIGPVVVVNCDGECIVPRLDVIDGNHHVTLRQVNLGRYESDRPRQGLVQLLTELDEFCPRLVANPGLPGVAGQLECCGPTQEAPTVGKVTVNEARPDIVPEVLALRRPTLDLTLWLVGLTLTPRQHPI
jgi:hypothetical protein